VREFSYAASPELARADTPAPAPAPGASPAAVPGEVKPFSYPETDRKPAQGTPADQLPDAVRKLREERGTGQWGSPQNDYRDSGLEAALALPEIPAEQQAMVAAEYREIFRDYSMSTSEARDAVSLARDVIASPPDEATQGEWRREAVDQLVRLHGGDEKEATASLELARAAIARDPRVADLIARHPGLGDHPKFVMMMVEKGRQEKARGRL